MGGSQRGYIVGDSRPTDPGKGSDSADYEGSHWAGRLSRIGKREVGVGTVVLSESKVSQDGRSPLAYSLRCRYHQFLYPTALHPHLKLHVWKITNLCLDNLGGPIWF